MKHKVVLVHVGSKYSHEYVTKLERALARHTTHNYELDVMRNSVYPGWWAKLDLFNYPTDRHIVYIDLDTLILKNIDFLFEYEGEFAILKDWWAPGYNSSVMVIAPGAMRRVYDEFHSSYMTDFHSDQEWISLVAPHADILPMDKIGSYKACRLDTGPRDYSIVTFHGYPKPHDFPPGTWVAEEWR